MVDTLPLGFGSALTDSTVARVRSMLQPKPSGHASQWFNWGVDLHYKLSRYAEAERAYLEAIARAPKAAKTWNRLGDLLQDHLHRYAEAEAAYRKAIAYGPKLAESWNDLGDLLQDHLQRYAEAETAYHEAISRDFKHAAPWNGLGGLLQHHLQRYAEAEIAYREAIARDPKQSGLWNNLGSLLEYHLDRYDEAEITYRKAIDRDPELARAWNGLGNLYCDGLGPSNASGHQNRLFLRRDFIGEGPDARPLMAELRALPSDEFPDTTNLHEALFAAYDSNWGLACESLGRALGIRADGFEPFNTDDWLRASAVLLHLNYGAELVAFLDQHGDTTARLRPWVESLRAHHLGDRRALQNIAPEIRTAAEIFYDGIESRLQNLPETTRRRPPAGPTGRGRRRKPIAVK
jgi:tetratricopeptide (TPR) repeat protein